MEQETIPPELADEEVGPVVSHLQTDTLCADCGYNLVTQPVLRDRRLGVLVCRCPECGRFSPAGLGATAGRVWLNRLATALVAQWVIFLLALFLLATFFLGMMCMGHVLAFVGYQPGQKTLPNGSVQYTMQYTVAREADLPPEGRAEQRQRRLLMAGIAAAIAVVTGVLYSLLVWHARGVRRWIALAFPIVGAGGAMFIWSIDPAAELIRRWGYIRIAEFAAIELLFLPIGIFIGRPIARAVLTLLLPAKLRQHLAFLWMTDGKRAVMS